MSEGHALPHDDAPDRLNDDPLVDEAPDLPRVIGLTGAYSLLPLTPQGVSGTAGAVAEPKPG
jgi:hypothetical protein